MTYNVGVENHIKKLKSSSNGSKDKKKLAALSEDTNVIPSTVGLLTTNCKVPGDMAGSSCRGLHNTHDHINTNKSFKS